jgi:hypothetical protein
MWTWLTGVTIPTAKWGGCPPCCCSVIQLNKSTTRDLILMIWNVLDRNLDDTVGIINAYVDLFEEEEKKSNLLSSWNSFKIEVFGQPLYLCHSGPDSKITAMLAVS